MTQSGKRNKTYGVGSGHLTFAKQMYKCTNPTPFHTFIGLGSNQGDRLAFLRQARAEIGAIPACRVTASAPVYETEPVGVPEAYRDAWFLNTVLSCETSLTAQAWLDALHAIEDRLCRKRTNERNAPRTIDIDILTYGDLVLNTPSLTLPHPQCTLRRFVCQPFSDLASDLIHPGHTETIQEIVAKLPMTPIVRKVAQVF